MNKQRLRLCLGELRELLEGHCCKPREPVPSGANGIFRVTEGRGHGVEEVRGRVTTSAGKVLFSIFKSVREKQGLGPGPQTMPGLLPTAGE